jgi:hypothetical protein
MAYIISLGLVCFGTRWLGVSGEMCCLFYDWKKDKLISPKLDTFQKHDGRLKVVVATAIVVVSKWFYYKDASHN